MKKPILIDRLVTNQINKNLQHEATEFNGKWYIAKPVSFVDLETLIERFYHAYLILVGKAVAIQYKEDQI